MAHGEHQGSSTTAVERSSQRGLEGQGLIPLEPAASASSGLHQVRLPRHQSVTFFFFCKLGKGLGGRGHILEKDHSSTGSRLRALIRPSFDYKFYDVNNCHTVDSMSASVMQGSG